MRQAVHRYRDPLDTIWEEALRAVGLSLERTEHAYATSDGRGRLALATDVGLDADDCVAQMVLHELCHSLVQGQDSFELPDWGLCNESERDVVLEHACLRVQAALLAPHGLRRVLAPTTDYRSYYDALPHDPFAVESEAEVEEVLLARAAYARRGASPWAPHLERALVATRDVVLALGPHLPSSHLLSTGTAPPALHQSGLPARKGDETSAPTCATCAWAKPRGKSLRCAPSGRTVGAQLRACANYEPELDCQACGACCREAYGAVEVSARDPARRRHAALMVARPGGFDMAREDGRCVALRGGERLPTRGRPPRSLPLYRPSAEPFSCAIYQDRPKTCRDFTRQSEHCLTARRAVGLSL